MTTALVLSKSALQRIKEAAPMPLPQDELNRMLEKYLREAEASRGAQGARDTAYQRGLDSVLQAVQGLRAYVSNGLDVVNESIKGLGARVTLVEQEQEKLSKRFGVTQSGNWDIDAMKKEMELALTRRDLEQEKSKPKGILAEYGPKILTHVISVVLTGIITYAAIAASHH